jgi:hypothetical protein
MSERPPPNGARPAGRRALYVRDLGTDLDQRLGKLVQEIATLHRGRVVTVAGVVREALELALRDPRILDLLVYGPPRPRRRPPQA